MSCLHRDFAHDKKTLQNEQPLLVARYTKIINADLKDLNYIINVKQFTKHEKGMRTGMDRNKFQIHIQLPPKIDLAVTMKQEVEKPDVIYSDVERSVNLGMELLKIGLLFSLVATDKKLCL
ncbi:26S proteasome regulatory subunit 7, partial [Galemys pyrenaicus]